MSVSERVTHWLSNADSRAIPGLYAAVSIRPERTRLWLRAAGKAFVDPASGVRPEAYVLEQTARWVTQQSRVRMALIGGLAGLGGMVSIPPEAAATVVSGVRLAQRLAVVYGLDPHTDRGQMAVWQAVAAGFEVDLPKSGALQLRISSLPRLVTGGLSRAPASGALATSVVQRSAWWVGAHITRWFPIPVVSSGFGASAADSRVGALGLRMAHTLARLATAPNVQDAVEAVEVDDERSA